MNKIEEFLFNFLQFSDCNFLDDICLHDFWVSFTVLTRRQVGKKSQMRKREHPKSRFEISLKFFKDSQSFKAGFPLSLYSCS